MTGEKGEAKDNRQGQDKARNTRKETGHVKTDRGYGKAAGDMDVEASNEVAAPEESDYEGTMKLSKGIFASFSPIDIEDADRSDRLPYDASTLSMLDYHSAEETGQYFRRNGSLSDIPGHSLRRTE